MNEKILKLIEEVRAKHEVTVILTPYCNRRIGMSSMTMDISKFVNSGKVEQ